METITQQVQIARKTFETGKTKFLNFRRLQLKNLLRLLEENHEAIYEALYTDLKKPKLEAYLMEIQDLIDEIKFMLSEIFNWTKPENAKKWLLNIFDKIQIVTEPLGVVLIISPWNYPIRLSLMPFIGAVMAGNAVVVKMSELAPASAILLSKLFAKYMDRSCFPIIMGGVEETQELLKEKFDYVFFTGSTEVGKIIHSVCARSLTPCTLELGGKCPVVLHESANMEIAVRRILWGKFVNAGQSCIAPDFVLCSKVVERQFLHWAKIILNEFYGTNPKSSKDFGRIVNEKHFIRIHKMLVGMTCVYGGSTYPDENYIEPTIMIDVRNSDTVMKEEIFGPILPILNVESTMEAITYINRKEKPLALHIFANDVAFVDNFIRNTSSGTVIVNDCFSLMTCNSLPFGGVGSSGFGKYHGKFTFDTFSNKKAIFWTDLKKWKDKFHNAAYPPYSEEKLVKILKYTKKKRIYSMRFLHYIFTFLVGYFIAYFLFRY